MSDPIVFVTDYGRDDAYAASLVGSAWRIDPRLRCVDGTHGVPPGDVLAGAYHLKSLAYAFERRTVLCAIVDPGVGTERRAIAIEAGGVRCVAPDNGLVSYLWSEAGFDRRAVALDVPFEMSPTFAGRDLFSPAAAQLASGTRLEECGSPIDDPLEVAEAFATPLGTGVAGRVIVVDHFGNAITSIRVSDMHGAALHGATWPGGTTRQVVTTYAEIERGTVAALIGSVGHLEIAASRDPAIAHGGPALGALVTAELV